MATAVRHRHNALVMIYEKIGSVHRPFLRAPSGAFKIETNQQHAASRCHKVLSLGFHDKAIQILICRSQLRQGIGKANAMSD